MRLAVLSASVEIRAVFYLLYSSHPAIGRICSSAGLWDFFFPFPENNGMQKELQERRPADRAWSYFSSNCLIIGEWFPLSHYLPCRRRGRQMWLHGN